MLSYHMGLELGSQDYYPFVGVCERKIPPAIILRLHCCIISIAHQPNEVSQKHIQTDSELEQISVWLSFSVQHLAFVFRYLFPKWKHFHYFIFFKWNSISYKKFYQLKAFNHSVFVICSFLPTDFKLLLKAILGHIKKSIQVRKLDSSSKTLIQKTRH